jgi:hypothetical protein
VIYDFICFFTRRKSFANVCFLPETGFSCEKMGNER